MAAQPSRYTAYANVSIAILARDSILAHDLSIKPGESFPWLDVPFRFDPLQTGPAPSRGPDVESDDRYLLPADAEAIKVWDMTGAVAAMWGHPVTADHGKRSDTDWAGELPVFSTFGPRLGKARCWIAEEAPGPSTRPLRLLRPEEGAMSLAALARSSLRSNASAPVYAFVIIHLELPPLPHSLSLVPIKDRFDLLAQPVGKNLERGTNVLKARLSAAVSNLQKAQCAVTGVEERFCQGAHILPASLGSLRYSRAVLALSRMRELIRCPEEPLSTSHPSIALTFCLCDARLGDVIDTIPADRRGIDHAANGLFLSSHTHAGYDLSEWLVTPCGDALHVIHEHKILDPSFKPIKALPRPTTYPRSLDNLPALLRLGQGMRKSEGEAFPLRLFDKEFPESSRHAVAKLPSLHLHTLATLFALFGVEGAHTFLEDLFGPPLPPSSSHGRRKGKRKAEDEGDEYEQSGTDVAIAGPASEGSGEGRQGGSRASSSRGRALLGTDQAWSREGEVGGSGRAINTSMSSSSSQPADMPSDPTTVSEGYEPKGQGKDLIDDEDSDDDDGTELDGMTAAEEAAVARIEEEQTRGRERKARKMLAVAFFTHMAEVRLGA